MPEVLPRLIALEGIDGSGKTTLAQRLAFGFSTRGAPVMVTYEPGVLPPVREMTKNPDLPLTNREQYLLFLADRLVHLRTVIGPAISRGEWVITDRYHWSSLVYQGMWATEDELTWMYDVAFGVVPEAGLTVLLSCDPQVAHARTLKRNGDAPDRFDHLDVLKRADKAYGTLSRQQSLGRKVVVDTTAGVTEEHVERVLNAALAGAGRPL